MPIIAVVSTKGGTGKTTTAYNLAIAMNPDRVFDQDLHTGLRVLSQLRDKPLPFPLEHYQSVDAMLSALQDAVESNETVLVDVGGFDSDIARAVVAVADVIITPCNDTPTDRIGLARFDMMLSDVSQRIGRTLKAHALICKAHHSQKRFPKLDGDLQRAQHLSRMKTIIHHRPDHYKPHEYGVGVTEKVTTRHGAAGKEITNLTFEVCQLLLSRV